MTGQRTLEQTRRVVADWFPGLDVDHAAMAATSAIWRAAGAIRNHVEREVLALHKITWTGWVVLSVIWTWEQIESRHAATEAGISQSTLTGVVSTLESRSLVRRSHHPDDGRRVLLSLTRQGEDLIRRVFPTLQACEAAVMGAVPPEERDRITTSLHRILLDLQPAVEGDA